MQSKYLHLITLLFFSLTLIYADIDVPLYILTPRSIYYIKRSCRYLKNDFTHTQILGRKKLHSINDIQS